MCGHRQRSTHVAAHCASAQPCPHLPHGVRRASERPPTRAHRPLPEPRVAFCAAAPRSIAPLTCASSNRKAATSCVQDRLCAASSELRACSAQVRCPAASSCASSGPGDPEPSPDGGRGSARTCSADLARVAATPSRRAYSSCMSCHAIQRTCRLHRSTHCQCSCAGFSYCSSRATHGLTNLCGELRVEIPHRGCRAGEIALNLIQLRDDRVRGLGVARVSVIEFP